MEATQQRKEVKEVLPSYLAQNLRCLRKSRQYSQEEMAQLVGLNRGNSASYENGTAEPKICNLLKISNLFGVTILDLTQRDLSDVDELRSARDTFARLSQGERTLLEQFEERSAEIADFLESIQNCYQFKTKDFEDLPRETKLVMHYYDQLHDVSQTLLRQHQALIDFVRCKCK